MSTQETPPGRSPRFLVAIAVAIVAVALSIGTFLILSGQVNDEREHAERLQSEVTDLQLQLDTQSTQLATAETAVSDADLTTLACRAAVESYLLGAESYVRSAKLLRSSLQSAIGAGGISTILSKVNQANDHEDEGLEHLREAGVANRQCSP